MKLTLFRRRRIDPAELPPVSAASVPGPLHSGLTGDMTMLAAALAGGEGLAAVAAETSTTTDPAPVPATTVWPGEPQPIPGPIPGAAPPGAPAPLWQPGRYTVTYSRIGEHGRRGGLPAPMPLTAQALTAADLVTAIATDVHALTGLRVSVMVDLVVDGGLILGDGGARLGTFTYEQRGGAAR
jgi:hypothetical protein